MFGSYLKSLRSANAIIPVILTILPAVLSWGVRADLALRGSTDDRHGYWFGEGYRLDLEAHCVECNRRLTTPDSIRLGIGPECRSKVSRSRKGN